jgi:hypothetical protein
MSNKKINKCPQPSYSCNPQIMLLREPKKDNSSKGDIFLNCRSCGDYIRGDYRSNFDKRYCQDCA